MPGRNGMGPMGQGPMTGRGMGWCTGASARVSVLPRGPGYGMGWGGCRGGGRGGGRGYRHWYYATGLTGWQRAQMGWPGLVAASPPALSKEQERALLMQQAESLEQTLGELKSRIQDLAKPTPDATAKEQA